LAIAILYLVGSQNKKYENLMKRIAVLGAGAWGTALAITSHNAGNDVLVWGRNPDVIDAINNRHENDKYLPNIKLPNAIQATDNIEKILKSDALLIVVPAQKLRETCENLKKAGLAKNIPLIICCKGIEQNTHALMSEVVAEILPNPVAILSGPNFAGEIASGLPAAATIAATDKKLGMEMVNSLGSQFFRLYFSDDIIGAQIGGAVKNVLAIACGIAVGKGLGKNSSAALVTRGVAEIGRLCIAKGGKLETLMGLSGIGDIMLTCSSTASRNMALGFALGAGTAGTANSLVEGVATAQSVSELANKLKVDMPICRAVNEILHKGADINLAVKELLQRPFGVE
jgi:glycerol-3-phosphate dehydrogenase (NAD(P)+)